MNKKILLITLILSLFLITGCSQKTGTLSLKLTDAPPEDLPIEKALVTISQIEVHKANTNENDSSSWITVIEEAKQYDLIQLMDASTLLGENDISIGKYTQVRLSIDKLTATIAGQEVELKVPSEKIKLTKGFTIEEGKTTTLTLDFDAQQSIKERNRGEYIMNPVIKIIEG